MDMTLDSPSLKKPQSNKLAVFSSIENRSDLLEGRSLNINDEMNKNIRQQNNTETKRYSLPHNVKDSFYAIHHIQSSMKENELYEENKKTKRKRVTTPPPAPVMTTNTTSRKKPRQTKIRKSSNPSLYQTCVHIWPEESEKSLGDFSHDHIKSLSNLLKVRLCQAKFKMMAKLDQDNELFTFLAEEYVPPKPKSPIHIKMNSKNKSALSVVGNGRNLFKRHQDSQDSQEEQNEQESEEPKAKEKKKRTPRNTSKKRKSAAADVAPILQSDGSSVYVCEPCNKKYKNRNGLAYHLERCKYTKLSQEEEQEQQQNMNHIQCICNNTEEHGTMIQCDKCRIWLHSECINIKEDDLDNVFYCTNCKEQKDLLQCLLEQQQQEEEYEEEDEDEQLLLLSQQEDDYDDNSSNSSIKSKTSVVNHNHHNNQLHVWDDFSFQQHIDNNNTIDNEEPFSSYDNDLPSSSWTMNDLNIFSQPPSLLFSDATALSSTLDEDNGNITGTPLTVLEENDQSTPINTPVHNNNNTDGLWFQFANFDDDYQCES